ncbi:MAG: HEAT repeat domain-containing protein [Kiritimatiellae bacterium]|nr:HEAT repeat domain-containing protein [Kiritimatiellia bacterium]
MQQKSKPALPADGLCLASRPAIRKALNAWPVVCMAAALACAAAGVWLFVPRDDARARDAAQPEANLSPSTGSRPVPRREPALLTAEQIVARVERAWANGDDVDLMLRRLARGDEESVRALLALARDSHLRVQAIETLGRLRRPSVREQVGPALSALIDDGDRRVACAALHALKDLQREAAVPELVRAIHAGARPEGGGQDVRRAAVAALGELAHADSLAALLQELERVRAPGWLPEHGSGVIAALQAHDRIRAMRGRRGLPSADAGTGLAGPDRQRIRAALLAYAAALDERTRGGPNRASRQYLENKKAEALQAARFGQETEPAAAERAGRRRS